MELISKEDPRYFSQTSDIPYDRHHYRIVCQNKSFVVESWDEVQEYWWNNCHSPWFEGTVVHVIDKPKPKNNLKVLNEFISRRKNHRFGVDYLCVFCYTTCINLLRCDNAHYC